MPRKEHNDVRRIASIGGGPIGGGWSAHFLAHGYEVINYIHTANEESALRSLVATAWKSLASIGVVEGASPQALRCTTDLAEAVADADFVQESAPEDLELKQELYATLGDLVPEDVVISSSTSGLSMTEIQAHCSTPARTVVGHPFNPPYLLPLVEMVGGAATDADAVAWAAELYRLTGKTPLILQQHVPGFVATRLQEALWREALHMIANGEATVEQIELAVVNGPGPRWALLGPCMAYHVGGGEGGMAHTLDQFGPALKLPWSRLEAPELTDELRDRLVEGCNRLASGRDFATLSDELNEGLVAITRGRPATQNYS